MTACFSFIFFLISLRLSILLLSWEELGLGSVESFPLIPYEEFRLSSLIVSFSPAINNALWAMKGYYINPLFWGLFSYRSVTLGFESWFWVTIFSLPWRSIGGSVTFVFFFYSISIPKLAVISTTSLSFYWIDELAFWLFRSSSWRFVEVSDFYYSNVVLLLARTY